MSACGEPKEGASASWGMTWLISVISPKGTGATHSTRVAGDQVLVVTSVAEHAIDRAANARGNEDQSRLDQKSTSALAAAAGAPIIHQCP